MLKRFYLPLSSCAEAARGGVAVQRFVTSWGVAVTLSEDMMSDDQCIPNLIEIASDSYQLQTAQHVAAKKLLDYDGEIFPQGWMCNHAISSTSRGRYSSTGYLSSYRSRRSAQNRKKLAGYFHRRTTGRKRWLYLWSRTQSRIRSRLSCFESLEF